MNKSIKFLLVLFIMSVAFIGCDKDETPNDDGNNSTVLANYFMHGANNYVLTNSIVFSDRQYGPGVYSNDVTLLTDGIIIHESNGMIDSVSGSGNVVQLGLATAQETTIDVGDYVFSDNMPAVINTCAYAGVMINYISTDEDAVEEYEAVSGKVTVVTFSTIIEVTFEFIDDSGKTIKGHYKGAFSHFSDSGNKSNNKIFF